MILHIARWIPTRSLVVVADGTYAVRDVLWKVSRFPHALIIARVRLDACVSDPAPVRDARKRGRQALTGNAQPALASRLSDPPTQWKTSMLSWYRGTT
jgi:hypothetical protein